MAEKKEKPKGIEEFDSHGKTLRIKFSSKEAASGFKHWLCGSGEQHYWQWMESSEEEEAGPITAVSFDYWTGTDDIMAVCGRLDDEK